MPSLADQIHRLFQKLGFTKSSNLKVSREAERIRNQNILKGINAGTWDWNIVTGELIINERWAEIIGYTLEELTPIAIDGWENSVHPDDLKIASAELDKHFSKEINYYGVQFRQ